MVFLMKESRRNAVIGGGWFWIEVFDLKCFRGLDLSGFSSEEAAAGSQSYLERLSA